MTATLNRPFASLAPITVADRRDAWASEHRVAFTPVGGHAVENMLSAALADFIAGRISVARDRQEATKSRLAELAKSAREGTLNRSPLEAVEAFVRDRQVVALAAHPASIGATGLAFLGRLEAAGLSVLVGPEPWHDRAGLLILIANPAHVRFDDPHRHVEPDRFLGRTGRPRHVGLR